MTPALHIEVPGGATKVLLHACCAPCSSAIVECLMKNGIRPVIFYSNSNIYPFEEYGHRLNECLRYAKKWGLEIVEDQYNHDAWESCAAGLENEPERGGRCLKCFKFRLLRAAEYASAHGFEVLTRADGPAPRCRASPGGTRTGAKAASRSAGTRLSRKKTFTTSSTAAASTPKGDEPGITRYGPLVRNGWP